MYPSQATRMLFRLKNLRLLPKELASRANAQWQKHGDAIWEGCGTPEGDGISAWLGDFDAMGDADEEFQRSRDILMAGKVLYRIRVQQKEMNCRVQAVHLCYLPPHNPLNKVVKSVSISSSQQ